MLEGILKHPLSTWHLDFMLNDQTRRFGIITNLTSGSNLRYNTYCTYNNCFVDNPMLLFEENKIFDFLNYRNPLKVNNTFESSVEDYQHVLHKRILNPNRDYMYLKNYSKFPYKHILYLKK
jgi:hypothetical protein